MSDIGILGIMVGCIFGALRVHSPRSYFRSRFSVIVLAFLFLTILSPFFAEIYYGQPYMVGLRAIRGNFACFFFFLLCLTLRTEKDIDKFIKWVLVIALVFSGLTIIQYLVPSVKVFHAENIFGERLGFVRWYNPGMDFVMLSFFFLIGRLAFSSRRSRPRLVMLLCLLCSQVLLSQTRSVLAASYLASLSGFLFVKRARWGLWGFWISGMLACVFLVAVFMGSSVVTGSYVSNLFQSTYSEVASHEGNVGARYNQAEMFMRYGLDHPLTGSGIISPIGGVARVLRYPWQRTDLGYIILFSQFGILGLSWLLWLSTVFFRKAFRVFRLALAPKHKGIVFGVICYFVYALISFVTLPHFTTPEGMVIITSVLAVLQAVDRLSVNTARA